MHKKLSILTLFILAQCSTLNSISNASQSLNSISTSVNSISRAFDSVSSISNSVGSISGSSSKKAAASALYHRDVRDLTYLSVKNGQDLDFTSELNLISQGHGFLNWQDKSETYLGIGEGLRKAGVNEPEFKNWMSGLKLDISRSSLLSNGFYGRI
ncbi:MAG TPA: putative lipoprotein [Leptospiraceae bacterium]|nr:putative lipoprotein [Leptospiraceae bacterium]HNF16724.1 putative lipoprotein [Leptospiraceae bacterium]HNF26916.1 putative lipoprotein [Leptospiraceae bacterium]HNI98039.1 putative lipoprotein [Leptospiraceae bacterium]HNM01321.1 putative lipoprotein [Leptospiraceae bacterium]